MSTIVTQISYYYQQRSAFFALVHQRESHKCEMTFVVLILWNKIHNSYCKNLDNEAVGWFCLFLFWYYYLLNALSLFIYIFYTFMSEACV